MTNRCESYNKCWGLCYLLMKLYLQKHVVHDKITEWCVIASVNSQSTFVCVCVRQVWIFSRAVNVQVRGEFWFP